MQMVVAVATAEDKLNNNYRICMDVGVTLSLYY
jgi:hypothetical protein